MRKLNILLIAVTIALTGVYLQKNIKLVCCPATALNFCKPVKINKTFWPIGLQILIPILNNN
jgi:hypothetical protein